jgi:hypothetical protein
VRTSDLFTAKQLAALREEHTATGAHRVREEPFPQWVPHAVMTAAQQLTIDEALAQLPAFLRPK